MARLVALSAILVTLLLIAAAPAESAVSCRQIGSLISPCSNYASGNGPLTAQCCKGVKTINDLARTTPDRQAACSCLKSAAVKMADLKPNLAARIPGACGVNLPYTISTTINCARVR